jgi:prepilin-type N-terminal cleavage/methylation domain-containing protein
MLARLRKTSEENEGGFTLIELLVVMIIIGILAAIAIPVFLSQRAKARDTAAKADVSTLGKELATYYVDNVGAVPAIALAGAQPNARYTLNGSDIGKASQNVTAVVANATATNQDTGWCVQVTYSSGTKTSVAYSAVNGLGALGTTCAAGVMS